MSYTFWRTGNIVYYIKINALISQKEKEERFQDIVFCISSENDSNEIVGVKKVIK